MIVMQYNRHYGTVLIVNGVGHRFDLTNIYSGQVNFKYINLEPVNVVSYLTQGNTVEKVFLDDKGKVQSRFALSLGGMMSELKNEQLKPNFIRLLTRNIILENVESTQYIVLYRK